jgi:hypothetical protein
MYTNRTLLFIAVRHATLRYMIHCLLAPDEMDTRDLGGALHPTFNGLPRGPRRDVVEPSGESAK